MNWQYVKNVEPPIGKIFMLIRKVPGDLFFARRVGDRGERLQLSTAYFNGGIGNIPNEFDYSEFINKSRYWMWSTFVKP